MEVSGREGSKHEDGTAAECNRTEADVRAFELVTTQQCQARRRAEEVSSVWWSGRGSCVDDANLAVPVCAVHRWHRQQEASSKKPKAHARQFTAARFTFRAGILSSLKQGSATRVKQRSSRSDGSPR